MNRAILQGRGKVIVIGSGVAGCSTALVAAERYGLGVTLLCAGSNVLDCNSYWAQGGIIYRNYDETSGDSALSLFKDVKRAGAGKCKDDAVWKVSREGPNLVRELLLNECGKFANVPFDREENSNKLLYCLEASHSAPRIIHQADRSGKAITEHITAATVSHPLINVIPNSIVTDLITEESECIGVQYYNKGNSIKELSSHGVVLATGGLCGIYEHSTNPTGFNALGSSIGLALRAGAHVQDLEYIQFHPTALCIPNHPRFLLTEALRGAGAKLRDANGRAFAQDFHSDGELAPRDIVARGVYQYLQHDTTRHNVFLDIRHRDSKWVKARFPYIYQQLLKHKLDITQHMIPITPAAHYTCGGVITDLHGRTNINGLYAAGEAARTGLHGANRLASTSLLEGLVFGASVADYIGTNPSLTNNIHTNTIPHNPISNHTCKATSLLTKLRQTMWDYVGVTRTPTGTHTALRTLTDIRKEACDLYHEHVSVETVGLRDAAYAGEAVASAAHRNRTSAGAHYMEEEQEDQMLMSQ